MKYVVEVCYGNRNEWSDEFDYYGDALDYAIDMSKLQGVGETKVWFEEEVVDTVVDGIVQRDEEQWDEWAEYEDRWDEVGYDPYTGGFDADL